MESLYKYIEALTGIWVLKIIMALIGLFLPEPSQRGEENLTSVQVILGTNALSVPTPNLLILDRDQVLILSKDCTVDRRLTDFNNYRLINTNRLINSFN